MALIPGTSESDGEGRFSLHRLSAAFARLTGETPLADITAQTSDAVGEAARTTSSDRQVISPRMIVEGMLFVGRADGRPVSGSSMAAQIRDVSPAEVDAIVAQLNEIYQQAGCSYRIASEGTGYRMELLQGHENLRLRISGRTKQVKLTPQAVEVLSVVAYRQPITAEDVSKVRGSRSDALLNQLIRHSLLQLERSSGDSKPVYRTTNRFNELLNISSPADLPQSEDLDDC